MSNLTDSVDVESLGELETGEELTFQLDHDTTGERRELTGTVADHPYFDAHDDWAVVLTDVTRGHIQVASGGPGNGSGHVIIYQDGSVESRPNASRQIHIGEILAVVTSVNTADPEPGEGQVETWCPSCKADPVVMDREDGTMVVFTCGECGKEWTDPGMEMAQNQTPRPSEGEDPEVMTDGGEGLECVLCGAVDDDSGVDVRVEQHSDGENYSVCNNCEPVGDGDGEAMTDGGVDVGEVAVQGVEPCDRDGPYGDADPYEEHLTVTIAGEEHHVPVTGLRRAAFDFRGYVPPRLDFDRVFRDGMELHAETELDDGGVVELYREGVSNTWTLERFADPVDDVFTTVWQRED